MSLRSLLNLAYAALVQGRDEDALKKFDAELEAEPLPERSDRRPRAPQVGPSRGVEALMAAARMPQAGAGAGPRKPKGATT